MFNCAQNILEEQKCKVQFTHVKVCKHFKIDTNYRPPNIQSCQRIRTTYNDRRCPLYTCVSKVGITQRLFRWLKSALASPFLSKDLTK
jgi:hypothetical protein